MDEKAITHNKHFPDDPVVHQAHSEQDKYLVSGPETLPELDLRQYAAQNLPEVDARHATPQTQGTLADQSIHAHYASAQSTEARPKTICGLRRRTFLFLAAFAVIGIIVLAVGLGVGLGVKSHTKSKSTPTTGGTVSSSSNSTSSSNATALLEVSQGTGLASTTRADGAGMLLYYQLPNGSVVEEFYPNSTVTEASMAQSHLVPESRGIISTPGIVQGSDLTALSFMRNGAVWRSLFYVDTGNHVHTTNSSSLGSSWGPADLIDDRTLGSGSPALLACYFPGAGIRLYLGNSDGTGYITKIENGFETAGGSDEWHEDLTFLQMSASGGCACTDTFVRNDEIVQDVYFRDNGTDANVVHWQENGTSTNQIQEPLLDAPQWLMASSTGMAVAVDGNRTTSFLFYKGVQGHVHQVITLLTDNPSGTASTPNTWQTTMSQINIAAVWVENGNQGPLVIYEDPPGNLRVVVVTFNTRIVANASVYAPS